jgi:hypothetical protein
VLYCDAVCTRLPLLTPLTKSDLSLNSTDENSTYQEGLLVIGRHYIYIFFAFMIRKQFPTYQKFFLKSPLEQTKPNCKKRTAFISRNRKFPPICGNLRYVAVSCRLVLNVRGISQLTCVPLPSVILSFRWNWGTVLKSREGLTDICDFVCLFCNNNCSLKVESSPKSYCNIILLWNCKINKITHT